MRLRWTVVALLAWSWAPWCAVSSAQEADVPLEASTETVQPDLSSSSEGVPRLRSYAFLDAMFLARENPSQQVLVTDNLAAPAPRTTLADANNLSFDGEFGWRATLGWAYDGVHAIEFTYFGCNDFNASLATTDNGNGSRFETRDVFFFVDPGLVTENITINYQSDLASYEANLRRQWRARWQTLLGLRYIKLDEEFGTSFLNTGGVTPFRPQSTTQNDLFCVQVGANWQVPVLRRGLFDMGFKLGFGGNSARQSSSAITDDLFINESRSARTTQMAGFGELNISGGWRLRDNVLLYAGYHATRLQGVALAPVQFEASDFNAGGATGIDNGSHLWYHGLVGGLHFFW